MEPSVLIIGAGPVGLTLAAELTRYGVGVRIVDKAAARTDKSKALVLWSRTLELLDRGGHGGSAPFVGAGFKVHGATFVAGGDAIGRVTMDGVSSPHAYALMIPQSETERVLEERLAAQGVVVERGTEATVGEIGPDGAAVVLRRAEGWEEAVRTPWLVGCDGAHSAVRHALGATFSGDTLQSDWCLADLHMAGYPLPDTELSIHWHRDGVLVIFPMGAGRYRIIGDLPRSESKVPPPPTLEEVQNLVDRRGPAGTTLSDPVWLSGFRINERKVAAYRYGRAFLAGDAAHIHSPAGGQGMNTGMQDAFNLAWKLALVVRGRCGEAILDSYTPERSRVGDEVLEAAGRLTTVATLRNPVLQMLRNLAGHVLLGLSPVTRAIVDTMSEVAVHYPESPLHGPRARQGLRPGERVQPIAGQVPVGAGAVPRFALFAEPTDAVARLAAAFSDIVEAKIRPPLHEGLISLARPDGYLACSSAEARAIEGYLRRIAAGPAEQAVAA